ncbi:hypothetical protein M433DRAFT_163734 [Acidomyces richmondensis BFW]|nr:MAG: hypothetical protein FE78DRAFT_103656 [Acidomyces sp. 'richmondensis']KYG48106.1 hypothetical protein M433DRAFT_163734 [Acidomyces richmondensis BFW]
MSTLISSAVAGKQAAPKGPARRRAAPPPPPPPAPATSSPPPPPVPDVVEDATSHVPIPSPPTLPTPVTVARTPPPSQQEARTGAPTPIPTPIEIIPPPAAPAPPTQPQVSQPAPSPVGEGRKRKSVDTAAPPPAKKRQRRSPARINGADQENDGGEGVNIAEDVATATTKRGRPNKPRTAKKRKRAPTNERDAETNGGDAFAQPAPIQRRGRPSKSRSGPGPNSNSEADEEEVDEEEKTRRKLAREAALESHEHDADETSMWEISRDSRHGRVSQLERDMRKIDWRAVRKRQREEAEAGVLGSGTGAGAGAAVGMDNADGEEGGVMETTEGPDGESVAADGQQQQEQQQQDDESAADAVENVSDPPDQSTSGPQYKVINNEIVLDEPTLTLTAPRVPSPTAAGMLEEETDLTRVLNRNTHINARRRHPADRLPPGRKRARGGWSEEDTERFYEAVEVWGMDWEMVARLFQGKDRGMCKRKWEVEGKVDPKRVEEVEPRDGAASPIATASAAAPSMSLTSYAAHTGLPASTYTKYRDMAHFLSVMRDDMREEETRMRAERAEEEGHRRAAEEQAKGREEAKRKAAESKKTGGRGKKGGKRGWRGGEGMGTLGGG